MLKLEFFKDEIDEVSVFFKTKYRQWNWTININTRWWSKEKQERKMDIQKKAIEDAKKKLAKQFEIPKEQLLHMKKTIIDLFVKRLNDFIPRQWKDWKIIEPEPVNVKDAKDILQSIKIELQEPIVVSRNQNSTTIEISDEDRKAIDDLINLNIDD